MDINHYNNLNGKEIAVIGMAGRLPMADSLDVFWDNLKMGRECITFFSDKQLNESGVPDSLIHNSQYVKAKGVLEHADHFDADFFGISYKDVCALNIQARVLLETVWEALEDAGYYPKGYLGRVGIFSGASFDSAVSPTTPNSNLAGEFGRELLKNKDFINSRIAYLLDLRGPCVTIQTACSTSLAAVHLACQSLLYQDCDIALAGGVSVTYPLNSGYLYQKGSFLSSDGHCRAFSEEASGTIGGNGAGVVVLKRLTDAVKDHDYIHAIIKGTAMTNDGADKIGYTAPSLKGIARAASNALKRAEVTSDTIDFVEMHGSGTKLGDTIEVAALTEAYGLPSGNLCPIGSVKTNIGHLDTAAGIAGLIKVILAIKNRQLPPSLNCENPNTSIHFENTPFFVNTQLISVPEKNRPFRAAVNSFGMGGSNVHAIVESYENAPVPSRVSNGEVIILSAKTHTALTEYIKKFDRFFAQHADLCLRDIAYTLQAGRMPFDNRVFFVCKNIPDVRRQLLKASNYKEEMYFNNKAEEVALFLYPFEMDLLDQIQELYHGIPAFKETLKSNFNLFQRTEVDPFLSQDSLFMRFIYSYSFSKFLLDCGLAPNIVFGCGEGLYTAACLSGIVSLKDMVILVKSLDALQKGESTYHEYLHSFQSLSISSGVRPIYMVQEDIFYDIQSDLLNADFWIRFMPSSSGDQRVWYDWSKSGRLSVKLFAKKQMIDFHCKSEDMWWKKEIHKKGLEGFYNAVGTLWGFQIPICWEALQQGRKGRKIPLPTYPFEKKIYRSKGVSHPVLKDEIKYMPPSEWFYIPSWKREESHGENNSHWNQNWLVFDDESDISSDLIHRLKGCAASVTIVRKGDSFLTGDILHINPDLESSFLELFQRLGDTQNPPQRILYLWGFLKEKQTQPTPEQFEFVQKDCFQSLIYIVRTLSVLKTRQHIKLITIGRETTVVLDDDIIRSPYVIMPALGKVAAQEYPHLQYSHIDIPWTDKKVGEKLFGILGRDITPEKMAIRGNTIWVPTFDHLKIKDAVIQTSALKKDGVYLVFGGMGNIGLALAEQFAQRSNCKLILVSRSYFPKRERWEKWIQNNGKQDRISQKIMRLMSIERLGSKIALFRADISNQAHMEKLLCFIRSNYAQLNGIIDAAGFVGESAKQTIEEITSLNIVQHFQAKAKGLFVLEQVFDGIEVDFCLCISSMAAVLGGIGLGGYTAANAFMDAFVQEHNQKSKYQWTSVNLDTWLTDQTAQPFYGGIPAEEGGNAINTILNMPQVHQILLSVTQLNKRMEKIESVFQDQEATGKTPLIVSRVPLAENSIESRLIAIWKDFFEIEDITSESDFFKLGGDSLKLIELLTIINQEFQVGLNISDFFSKKTIHNIGQLITKEMNGTDRLPEFHLAPKQKFYPVSCIQRMLYLPESVTYTHRPNLANQITIEGTFCVEQFERALNQIVQRHEAFRTSFHQINGEVVQQIHGNVDFHMGYQKCDENTAQTIIHNFVQPFQLENAPLFRVTVLEITEEKFYILMDMHHILYDEKSLDIIFSEIWKLYRGETLEVMKYHYKDYAVWQHDWLKGKQAQQMKRVGLRKMEHFNRTVLEAHRDQSCFDGFRVGKMIVHPDLYRQIDDFCSRMHLTKTGLILSALFLILFEETGQSNLSVGMRVSNRYQKEWNSIVGCFLEKSMICGTINPECLLKDYLTEMQRNLMEAMDCALFPFALVEEEWMKTNTNQENTERIRIMVNYMVAQGEKESGLPFIMHSKSIKKIWSKYEINFQIIDFLNRMELRFKYDASLYSERYISSILSRFLKILQRFIESENCSIKNLLESGE